MASHFRGPLLLSDAAGPFSELAAEAAMGESDLVTIFDDFNNSVPSESFGDTAFWEAMGWTLVDAGVPVADTVVMNGLASAMDSAIRINPGTAADTGGHMHILSTNGLTLNFPHMVIPSSGAGAAILDNTVVVFACRIGLISNGTAFDGKAFVGFCIDSDTSILTAATGVITQAETGPLVGFHIAGDDAPNGILGISQRTVNTAYAEGTNKTELYPSTALTSGFTSGVAQWYDLAVRMDITDMSNNSANGQTTFYKRKVPQLTSAPGAVSAEPPTGKVLAPWTKHATVLSNQTMNAATTMVPVIEILNGPTQLSDMLVDWWAFGISRYSRSGR